MGIAASIFCWSKSALLISIVTNPPFKLANQFISHAIDLGVKQTCLAAAPERSWKAKPGTNKRPPRAYVFSRRLTMWRGDEE